MANFLSSLETSNNLHTKAMNCCGNVRQTCDGPPGDFDNKTSKLNWAHIHASVRCFSMTTWKRQMKCVY